MTLSVVSFIPQLHSVLVDELQTAQSLCVAAALFSEEGVEHLRQSLSKNATVEVLVGLDLPTAPAALNKLLAWSSEADRITVRVWATKDNYFHPKVYLVQQHSDWVAFVGSDNCTVGGWQHNEELTVRVAGVESSSLRHGWFAMRFAEGMPLTAEFVAAYSAAFAARAVADEAARNAAKAAQQQWQEWLKQQSLVTPPLEQLPASSTDLSRLVRAGQYFQESHYAAFDGPKPRSKDATTNRERKAVYDRLFELHEALQPRIEAAGWELYPHYEEEHIVSSWKHGEYTEDALRAMWLNYGRPRHEVKAFDERHTPMHFLRLEAIVFNDHFATWCRIGKEGAIDREIFRNKMRRSKNQEDFFSLLQSFGIGHFVQAQNIKRLISQFTTATALAEFVKTDKQGNYFVIGKDYKPNDPEIAEGKIVETVMRDWTHLYRLYLWMRYE